jgi:hypothetical protein
MQAFFIGAIATKPPRTDLSSAKKSPPIGGLLA